MLKSPTRKSPSFPHRLSLRILALALILLVTLAACGEDSGTDGSAATGGTEMPGAGTDDGTEIKTETPGVRTTETAGNEPAGAAATAIPTVPPTATTAPMATPVAVMATPAPTATLALNLFESGQTIPDFPKGLPNVVSGGGSFRLIGGEVVITIGSEGKIKYSHATYTCVSGECGISNGRVTFGTVRVTEAEEATEATDPPAGEFASVSAGQYHTCGVKTDGSVACWGE